MNPKTTLGLLVAVAVALVGLWWAQSSEKAKSDGAVASPRRLFEPAIDELTSFELVTPGSGQTLKFEFDDAGKWRLTAPLRAPCEHFVVNADAQKLKDLEFVKAYAAGDADRPSDAMTSLAAPLRIVKLTDKSGKSHVLKIGARQALSTNTYVQKDGDDRVYLVSADLNADLARGLSDYRGKRVAEFDQNEAVRIEVSGEHRYTLVRSGAAWTVEEPLKARADLSKVNSLLSALSNMQAARFVEDQPASLRPFGLDPPRLTVRVTTEKRTLKPSPADATASAPAEPEYDVTVRTVGVFVGGKAEDEVFARLTDPESPSVFQISDATAKSLGQPIDEIRDKRVANVGAARFQKLEIEAEGRRVELTSVDNNWLITAGVEGSLPQPAEFAAVDDVLKAVRNLTAVGFEPSETPAQGFDRPRAVVSGTFEGAVEPIRLVFGGETPSGTGVYVRNDRENFVAVVKSDAIGAFTNPPASFMNRDLLRFPVDQLTQMELKYPEWTCVLEKSGGEWRMAAPVEGATESGVVQGICNDFSMLRGRKVVAPASEAAQFGLDKPVVRAVLTIQEPPPAPTTQESTETAMPPAPTTRTLLVSRKGDAVYAMIEGGRTICDVDPRVLDNLMSELLDRKVAEVDPSDVRLLTFGGEATIAFEKSGDAWKLRGEPTFPVDNAKVSDVLSALRDLRAARFVRYRGANLSEYGLDAPSVSLTAERNDGTSLTLLLSARGPSESERYAAVASQGGRVFVISNEDAAKFVRKVADFQSAG